MPLAVAGEEVRETGSEERNRCMQGCGVGPKTQSRNRARAERRSSRKALLVLPMQIQGAALSATA
jgi:hypothetical protein